MTASDLYRALWRRKLLIGALTAVLVGVTLFFSLRQTPIYEAETLVRIQQRIDDSSQAFDSIQASQRLTETYAQIIETGALAPRVERLLERQAPGIVVSGKDISAQPVQDLELLTVTARSPDPRRAALVANAVPDVLRNFIRETGTMRDAVVTVAPAAIPRAAASPDIPLNLVLAMLLGLLVNAGIALLVELLADRIPDIDELEDTLDLPVLATIPVLDLRGAASGPRGRGLRRGASERGLGVTETEGSSLG